MAKRKKADNSKRYSPPQVTITSDVYADYKKTLARHPPETVALLGGCLDKPFEITDYRFCPPARDNRGNYLASASHIAIDAEYMNWVIENEWRPNGKYILGIWHSHPAGFSSLSHGSEASNEGDVVYFTSCLNADDSPKENWNHFIAPITTFDQQGNDRVRMWILDKGSKEPYEAEFIVENQSESVQQVELLSAAPNLVSQVDMSDFDRHFDDYSTQYAKIKSANLPWDDDRVMREVLKTAFIRRFLGHA